MNKRNIVRFTVATLMTFMLTAPLLAQQNGPVRQQVTRQIEGRTVTAEVPLMLPPTEANFNQYRSDILAIMTAQRATARLMHLDDAVSKLDSAIQQMTAMQFSDVPPLQKGFVDLTALKAAVLGQQAGMAQAFANGGARVAQFSPDDPFPNAQYASFCPLNPQPPEVAFTAGIVALAAELAQQIAQDICNQVELVLGVGGNVRLVCIATDIINAVAQAVNYPIQACHADTIGAQATGTFNRLEYIHNLLDFSINNDNVNKAMLSTQLTNAENHIVTNDNNNKASLSGQIGSFQTLSIRMAIEANLAEDPTTITGFGLFEMPANRGGYLEVARQILIDTYNAQVAAAGAGVTVYNPSNELSLGATYTSQGKFREAYYYYRKGYRSVVKYP